MLLRQLFNHATFSYTYLLADPLSEEAVLIDPVKEKLRDYVQLFNELGYSLSAAIDTHYHDDYVQPFAICGAVKPSPAHPMTCPVLPNWWKTVTAFRLAPCN
jgi:glyoxylase-like metal-dependent hydrolase (beta-lactamase superfamily II)